MLKKWLIFDKLQPEQLNKIKHVHVFEGGRSALYITSGDVVYAVGANGSYNLLGLSATHRHLTLVGEPLIVERLSLKSIHTIAVGDFFGVANNTNGELYHWGRRMDRRRGILLPHQVKCQFFVVDVACGSEFFAILTKEQKVFIRGAFQPNDYPNLDFIEVSTGFCVAYMACGKFHAAMLSSDGLVYNCGYDHHTTYRTWKQEEGLIPKLVDIKERCMQVVCGRRSTVCVLSSGTVWACGENDNLGVESENSVMKQPAKIKIGEPIRELAATWFSNIYAASTWSGRIYFWGFKTRWPTLSPDGYVLLDVFHNRETPSSLGIIPVAPELTPYSTLNTKNMSVYPEITATLARRLARSMSAESLRPDIPESPKKDDTRVIYEDKGKNGKNYENKSSRLKIKHLPPGFGLLVSAGKYLATRPSDRQVQNNSHSNNNVVNHTSSSSKFENRKSNIYSDNANDVLHKSHSEENLDNPLPIKQNLKSLYPSTPVNSPEDCTLPNFYSTEPPRYSLTTSNNPFQKDLEQLTSYPEVPLPLYHEKLSDEIRYPVTRSASSAHLSVSKKGLSQSNPFLYDTLDIIKFNFEKDAAKCYAEKVKPPSTPPNDSKQHNPGTNTLLKYYCNLADIKKDVAELQRIVNEIAITLTDL